MGEPEEPQPPNYLVDMRKINDGIEVKEQGALKLKDLYERDYDKFLQRWMAAEDKWRQQTAKPQGKAKEDPGVTPGTPGEVDEGSERVEELLERLLKEAQP